MEVKRHVLEVGAFEVLYKLAVTIRDLSFLASLLRKINDCLHVSTERNNYSQ